MKSQLNIIADTEKILRIIASGIKRSGRKILRNYPITSPQFTALQFIVEQENLTIGELSKKNGLAFSTTTDLIDRMEKNGLVTRTQDKKDRRVVRVNILEKGKAIIGEVIEKRQEYLGNVLKGFSAAEIMSLNEQLNSLHEQMEIISNE